MRIRACGCPAHGLARGTSTKVCPVCNSAGCTLLAAWVACPGIRKPRRSKYGAKRTTMSGRSFHSKGEAGRAAELELAEKAGVIRGLQFQVPFELRVNGMKVGAYVADFTYTRNGEPIVEDFKSPATRTAAYVLKRKLMLACYGVEILETYAQRGGGTCRRN